jgi:penicillin amidase
MMIPMPRKPLKTLRAILLGVVLSAAILAGLVTAAGWASLPRARALARIPGLSAPVQISFDTDGVPRIHAANDLDAAAALGFVHARDRMFQMDLMRRVASGRLSEIAGSAGLNIDMLARTLNLRGRAQADLALLPPHSAAMLAAYSRGVNAWIGANGRFAAPEFLLLGRPAPWQPVDCLLWGKTMSLYLSGNYRNELTRLALARRIRPAQIDQLWPAQPQPPSPQASATPPALARLADRLNAALPRFPDPFTLPATASNEWAVDGAHSATGAPLLAGDPHLSFGLPSIWYLARIDTPQGVLAGATAPGIPFLVIGRNARIAWTFTTTGTDSEDVFVETPVDNDHYLTPTGPRAYITHDETIHVLGGSDRILHVRETRHGPVISDILDDSATGAGSGQILAVAMASLLPGDTAPAGLDALNQAQTLAQGLHTAPLITSPNQNLLIADARGIGLAVTGRVPVRKAGDGQDPVDGASGQFDWTGTASGPQLPQVVAPDSGRLVNANERIAPADFPVFLGHDWYGDWRAQRIRTLLDQHKKATVDDFAAMQADTISVFAQQILPVLRPIHPASRISAKALALLTGWGGDVARDRPQPLIFNAWMQQFALAVLDHEGVPISQGGPRLEFIAALLTGPQAAQYAADWCGGDCTPLLQTALEQSTAALVRLQGDDPAAWRWGRAHRAIFGHPLLSQIRGLGALTTRRIAAPGDDATLDRGGMAERPQPDFDDLHGASYRGVYDLANLDRSRFIVAPGQSGNLFSPHAGDFMRRWRDGKTILLDAAPHHIGATLLLEPDKGAP